MSPLWAVLLRVSTAGAALLMWAVVGRHRHATLRELPYIIGIGLSTNVVYLGLLYLALKHLSSAMASIIASTNPLMLALIAPKLLNERITASKNIALVVGFLGVGIIMAARAAHALDSILDDAIALLGVVGLVASSVLYKRARFTASLPLVTGLQMIMGGAVLLPLALLTEHPVLLALHRDSWAALLYLITVMSMGSSLLWFWLLNHCEATSASVYYYLTPIFGLALGVFVLHESVSPSDFIGMLMVAISVAIVNRRSRGAREQR